MVRFERYTSVSGTPFIDEVLAGQLTGAVIEDVLDIDLIGKLSDIIPPLNTRYRTDLNHGNGYSLPGMFGQLHKWQETSVVERYFRDIEPFLSDVENFFGENVQPLLEEILKSVLSPYPIHSFAGLLPFSLRIVFSGKGGLSLHKDGDLLNMIHESVEQMISSNIDPSTMMSWFFTIQQPAEGGGLWVADSKYEDYLKVSETTLQAPDGTTMNTSECAHLSVSTPSGSLLIFRGGNHWHSVIPPSTGDLNRITLGGFMALDKSGKSIVYWT